MPNGTGLQFPMVLTERPRFSWRLRTRSLLLGERTLVMAILNITPDSFSGDGLLQPGLAHAATTKLAIAQAIQALDDGADILDLGAESTRPDATPLDPDAEQDRLLPVLEGILTLRPDAILSVDTYHAETARLAARAGAEIINDVSGLQWDESMPATAAATGCGLVLMHTRGRPSDWSAQPAIPQAEVIPMVVRGLCDSLLQAEADGIATSRIVLDPGFGFGKRGAENFALLAGLAQLHQLGRPLLTGLSRKRFLGEHHTPLGRDPATLAANTVAALAGAHILRAHNIPAAIAAASVADALRSQGPKK
jgi:dihydropteroate synthase